MKKIILIALFATIALLDMDQAYGQMVYKDTNGKVILDCSADSKMQQNAVTTEKKYTAATTATNDAFILVSQAAADAANAKIYYKLEIAPKDIRKDGTLGVSEAVNSWAEAYNNCKKLNHNGTGWRLPTQRELQMMWIFRVAINTLLDYSFEADSYWSATEERNNGVWRNTFNDGSIHTNSKADATIRVRCVRDL